MSLLCGNNFFTNFVDLEAKSLVSYNVIIAGIVEELVMSSCRFLQYCMSIDTILYNRKYKSFLFHERASLA
jgi:hypothetical protein